MCLLLVAHDCCPGYRLVLAANRDEFHARPTAPAAAWHDRPEVIGGRDLEAGGTWLAVDTQGRFATITNVRAAHGRRLARRSRGLIVSDFLSGQHSAQDFTTRLADSGDDYDGFNVLTYDRRSLCWYSNQAPAARTLEPGIYTLSNALLDTVWPKTARLRAGFGRILGAQPDDIVENLLGLLRDAHLPDDDELPETGVGRAMERILASIFIVGESYGTRCSTVLLIDLDGRLTFHERRYDASGLASGDSRIEFELPPMPT
ncbi:MAG: NRDE family protein [Gammaproteobacteria bacterium]